jgi:hypothetical protein
MMNVFNKQQVLKNASTKRSRDEADASILEAEDGDDVRNGDKKHKKKNKKHKKQEDDRGAHDNDQHDVDASVVENDEVDESIPLDKDDDEDARRERKRLKKEAKKQRKLLAQQGQNVQQAARVLKAMQPVSSNDYVQHDEVLSMSTAEVADFWAETNISLIPEEEGKRYKPILSFAYLDPSLAPYSNLKGTLQVLDSFLFSPITILISLYS